MIVPDDKDWTWVLERACPECGFDASACAPDAVAALRENAATWRQLLDRGRIRAGRIDDGTWSSLDTRATFVTCSAVTTSALRSCRRRTIRCSRTGTRTSPRSKTGTTRRNHRGVVDEMETAAEALAARLESISGGEWQRRGRRSDGVSFTIASIARYMIHDPVHHLWDVRRNDPSDR